MSRHILERQIKDAEEAYKKAAYDLSQGTITVKKVEAARDMIIHLKDKLDDFDAAEKYSNTKRLDDLRAQRQVESDREMQKIPALIKDRVAAAEEIHRLAYRLGEQIHKFNDSRDQAIAALKGMSREAREAFAVALGYRDNSDHVIAGLLWNAGVTQKPNATVGSQFRNQSFVASVELGCRNALNQIGVKYE